VQDRTAAVVRTHQHAYGSPGYCNPPASSMSSFGLVSPSPFILADAQHFEICDDKSPPQTSLSPGKMRTFYTRPSVSLPIFLQEVPFNSFGNQLCGLVAQNKTIWSDHRMTTFISVLMMFSPTWPGSLVPTGMQDQVCSNTSLSYHLIILHVKVLLRDTTTSSSSSVRCRDRDAVVQRA
jgi:hypothetical protein